MSNTSLPPIMLLRSFLTVGSGFVLSLLSSYVILVALGYAFFPEHIDFLNLDIQTQETIMETNPETAIPPLMFWSMLVLNSIVCLAIGWLVIRTAPFAPYPHAVFLAVVMFISYLQLAIAQPQKQKSMTIAIMIAFPVAILIGAKLAVGRVPPEDHSATPSSEAD
jgi:hypothetical protein